MTPDRSERDAVLTRLLAQHYDEIKSADEWVTLGEMTDRFLERLSAAGYRLVPEGEWRALEAEWGRYQDALRTIATTTSKWTDCAAIALAALSVPEVTDE